MAIPNTIQRKGHYHFQIKVPAKIQPAFGSVKLIRKSLHTDNPNTATVQATKLAAEAKQGFASILVKLEGLGELTTDTVEEAAALVKSLTGKATLAAPITKEPYLLDKAIQDYIIDKTPDWGDKMVAQNEHILSMLLEIVGNKDVTEISPKDADLFKRVIRSLPANLASPKRTILKTRATLIEIAERARENKVKPRSPLTSNRQFILVGSFFRWMVLRDYVVKSYFERMTSKKKGKARDERAIYTPEQLHTAFDTLNDAKSAKNPHMYWVPLIALYSGMRVGEICQLHVSDVDTVQQTITIQDGDGRSVKTESSKRTIPIHSKLIELGFLDYVNTVTHKRLFPKLSKGADGYGHNLTRWWGNRSKRLGYNLGMHSLRHTFVTQAVRAGINDLIISQIVGHSTGSITTSRYSKGFTIEQLREAIEGVKYDL